MTIIMLVTKAFHLKLWLFFAGILAADHCCAGEVTLTELWNKAQTITYEIEDIFPNWHRYVFDDYSYPVNSIEDGGNDTFDIGNQIFFYEGLETTDTPLTYGETYHYNGSVIQVARNTHPFMAIAWIENEANETNIYTIKVEGNLGADGTGEISAYSGNVTNTDDARYLEYYVFQVYDADHEDPTVCEVYFAISGKEWNSVYPRWSLEDHVISTQTNKLSNAVRISGQIQNVAFGYALISTEDGEKIEQSKVEEFLKRLMQHMFDGTQVPSSANCGETILLSDTSVQKLSHNVEWYNEYHYCDITIQGLFGYKIEAFVTGNISSYEYLELYEGWNRIGTLRGNFSNVNVGTVGNVLRVTYSYYWWLGAYGEKPDTQGFTVVFKQYLSNCGQELFPLSTPMSIILNGSSNNSLTLIDTKCFWSIRQSGSNVIQLIINTLVLGNNSFLKIMDGINNLEQFTTNIIDPVTLYGTKFRIEYNGEPSLFSEVLFSATYKEYSCGNNYFLTENLTIATVVPLTTNIINTDNYYRCEWFFHAQPYHVLVLKVEFEGNALSSNVEIYETNTYLERIPHINGSTTYASTIGSLHISYTNYGYYNDAAFRLKVTYKQFKQQCGNFLSARSEMQNFTIDLKNATDCVWTIHGTFIKLTITDLQIVDGDYVEIYEGPRQIRNFTESLSSPLSLLTRSYLGMTVFYHTSSASEIRQFSVTYQEANCNQTYEVIKMSTETATIPIPFLLYQFTNIYSNFHQRSFVCNYIFKAEMHHVIALTIQRFFHLYISHEIQVYDNFTLLEKFYNNYNMNSTSNVISSSQVVTLNVNWHNYYYYYGQISNHSNGLIITYRQIERNCGKNLLATSTNQTILSPGYLSTSSNDDCVWVIRPSSYRRYVQLTIEELEIEDGEGYVEVRGSSGRLERFQYESTPIIRVSNIDDRESSFNAYISTLTVYFHGGSQSKFKATYKEVVCGKTIYVSKTSNSHSFSIPGYIYNTPAYRTCDYIFVSSGDDWQTLEVRNQYSESKGNVQIFEDNKQIQFENGKLSAINFITAESEIRLHYVRTTTSSNYNSYNYHYYAYYRSFASACGSTMHATTTEQTITSPGYPAQYGNIQDCIWNVTTSPQQQIRFTLISLDTPYNDYLEIYDGFESYGKYEGVINSPVTFLSVGDSIIVHFHSDYYNQRKGFKATIVEVTNACLNSPCKNNGICVARNDTYTCFCGITYNGSNCENFISPCLGNPCRGNGICQLINNNQSFQCLCNTGYTGAHCEDNGTKCEDNPCAENANCTNNPDGYTCKCMEGYRGNGKLKCYEIILLPYGEEVEDTMLPVGDDEVSSLIRLSFEIPFGSRSFSRIRVSSNGLIYLGYSYYSRGSLFRPGLTGFPSRSYFALLAPFWDDFHPSVENNGRVYYQSYNKVEGSLNSAENAIVDEVQKRIVQKFGDASFNPVFVFKATWSDVVMFPYNGPRHEMSPSTFQTILATDGCDTYLIYNYKEDAMLWQVGLRSTDNVLIGYTNGAELTYVESQREYRPDAKIQKEGKENRGQYLYKLTSSNTDVQKARCSCLKWYLADLMSQWSPDRTPCPCSSFQATQDSRFTKSVDYVLLKNQLSNWDFRSFDLSQWRYEHATTGQCYQPQNGTGPRCCYGSARRSVSTSFWGVVAAGPLMRGPFGSRYERFQIPIMTQSDTLNTRNKQLFNEQFNQAMDEDLIPRRQCCVDSKSGGYCGMYTSRRPTASCWGYFSSVPTFIWGDPHITTFTGVSYTFNGLGEFYLIDSPEFTLQSRTKRVLKEDGTLSDATGFTAFVAKDLRNKSGIVEFEIDYNGNGSVVLVKVDGVLQSGLDEFETVVKDVILKLDEGRYTATFPSQQSVSVKAKSYLLTIEMIADQHVLKNATKGLLGYWTENKLNTFMIRNGTILNYESLKVTSNLDILNGTLSERMLYPFGLSWQVQKFESLFNYTGGNDTYELHNPTNPPDPPFLEDLVAEQRNTSLFNSILTDCTVDGEVSSSCLYDTLTTNRSDIGQDSLNDSLSSALVAIFTSNTPPNVSVCSDASNFVDEYFQVKVNKTVTLCIDATDKDGDEVTCSLTEESKVLGVEVDPKSCKITWKPDNRAVSVSNSLTILATDSNGGESLLQISTKICDCYHQGNCSYDYILESETEDYQRVGCDCNEAWEGIDCSKGRISDIDECKTNTHNCIDASDCVNTIGGFYCESATTPSAADKPFIQPMLLLVVSILYNQLINL